MEMLIICCIQALLVFVFVRVLWLMFVVRELIKVTETEEWSPWFWSGNLANKIFSVKNTFKWRVSTWEKYLRSLVKE